MRVGSATSTITGTAPRPATANAVAAKVAAGTITSSPGRVPAASSASTSACVQDVVATAWPPQTCASLSSSRSVCGPWWNFPVSITMSVIEWIVSRREATRRAWPSAGIVTTAVRPGSVLLTLMGGSHLCVTARKSVP
ncbi:hypothetical protein OG288_37440 [Streptomyces tauricus]|uniref:Uncharacterized protein n=1 Tax=Streptomyces tauricus TaxID=68274 RepID=A0ABZ1JTJ0_9ACTN|nr:hypothetical protein [Streptomyces tauricus]